METALAMLVLVPLMMASYGLCFGLMNDKAGWLTGRLRKLRIRVRKEGEGAYETESTFFDRMFRCPYCTGFHTGWMTWIAAVAVTGWPVDVGGTPREIAIGVVGNVVCVGLYSFASSVFCYLADTAAQWLESSMERGE